jgi:acyl-CoA synthetase (AMP-forming)/AMP-acid ligase II
MPRPVMHAELRMSSDGTEICEQGDAIQLAEFALPTVQEAVSAVVSDRPAIRWRGREMKHGQFTDRSRRIANLLRAHGVHGFGESKVCSRWESEKPRVAVYMHNRPEWLETLFGTWKAKALPFNVNYRYVDEEFRQLMEHAQPSAIVYEARFAEQVDSYRRVTETELLLLQVSDETENALLNGALDYDAAIAAAEPIAPTVEWSPDDGYLLYTGGTSGLPKGVLWRQGDAFVTMFGGRKMRDASEVDTIEKIVARIQSTPKRTLSLPPFMHGTGQWSAGAALLCGDTVIIQDIVDHLDPHDVWSTVERERVDILAIVGNAFALPLVGALERRYRLDSLKLIVSGGVALTAEAKSDLVEMIPHITIMENAGSSETGQQMATRSRHGGKLSTGVFDPVPGTVVLAGDRANPVEPGSGEIGWLASRGRVPLGYLGDREATLSTFPELNGERYCITGDRARLTADAKVQLLGRESATINSGGEKIFVEEVEQALGSHPAVADLVVVGKQSQRWGTEVAVVVQWQVGKHATLDELRGHSDKTLAAYKLPRHLVVVEQVRRTPAGKPDYRWAAETVNDQDSVREPRANLDR